MTLYLDLETYSEADLRRVGAYRYAEDPTTEIMLVAYAFDNGPAVVWDKTEDPMPPADLTKALRNEKVPVVIYNSFFDRSVMRGTRLINLPVSRIHDPMVQALCHGLPAGLQTLCMVYGLPEELAKMKEGRQLVLRFAKPNRGKRNLPEEAPELWAKFIEYARHDVLAMRELYQHKLPRWNYPDGPEYELWLRDQAMNDRGFAVDMDLARAAVAIAEEERGYLNGRVAQITGGKVEAATQRDKLLEYLLKEHGVALPDMTSATLGRRLKDEELPGPVRRLIELRLTANKNAAAKFVRVVDCAVKGRLMGTTQFAGASRTLRDAGRLFQHQNLLRPTIWRGLKGKALEEGIEQTVEEIKTGAVTFTHEDDVMGALGSCIRSVIVAPPGRELHVADLSNIEGRMLVWLSGESWKVQFFRDFDTGRVGYDNYVLAYAHAMNTDPATVTSRQRAVGKVQELALGYEGGVGAFVNYADVYGVNLEELADATWATGDRNALNEANEKYEWAKTNGYHAGLDRYVYAACEYIKLGWREKHEATVAFWQELKEAFRLATLKPGTVVPVGQHLKFLRKGDYLRIRLPSGKSLTYVQPWAEGDNVGYMGIDQYTRKWQRIPTFGGKLAENVTSGTARDVLFRNLKGVEEAGFEPVFRVHDEVVAEADEGHPATLPSLIARNHDWCPDLPLAADGFVCKRYRKE